MNTNATVSVSALVRKSVNVPLRASCTPFTSVEILDRISPVRVEL